VIARHFRGATQDLHGHSDVMGRPPVGLAAGDFSGAHMAEEKRERVRYDVRYAVLLKTARGTERGVTRNLSGTGACICCRQLLKPKETFFLDIEFPSGPPFQVPAQVVWVQRPDSRGKAKAPMMGVRFMY
jgi:hypothetical protein